MFVVCFVLLVVNCFVVNGCWLLLVLFKGCWFDLSWLLVVCLVVVVVVCCLFVVGCCCFCVCMYVVVCVLLAVG